MKKVIESIKKYFPFKRAFIIFGSSRDKDIAGMAKELSGFASKIMLTSSNHPRAAKIDDLVRFFNAVGLETSPEINIKSAIADSISLAGKSDLILITGSLFLAAEATTVLEKTGERYNHIQATDSRCRKALNR